MNLIETLEREAIDALTKDKPVPEFRPGDTLRVGVKVIEGDRTRVQKFEGVCIARANKGVGSSFTVRKISFGEGVERVFPLYSPIIDKIEVVRRGDVRRAKLYYLRGRTGKAARIAERRDVRRDVPAARAPRPRPPAPRTRRSLRPSKQGTEAGRSRSAFSFAAYGRYRTGRCVILIVRRVRSCSPPSPRPHFAQRPAARARFRQPVAERADAAQGQAVARRPVRHAAQEPRRRQGPLRPVGDRHRHRRRSGCWSIRKKIGTRRRDLRRREDAARARAHRRHQGHHRLRMGAGFAARSSCRSTAISISRRSTATSAG